MHVGSWSIGAMSAWLNDQVAFTPSQLQRSLDNRFPRTFDKLGGLVAVTLANPRLSIPPGDTRLLKLFRMASRRVLFLLGRGQMLYHLIHVDDLSNIILLAATHPAAIHH